MSNSTTKIPLYSNEGKLLGFLLSLLGISSIIGSRLNLMFFPYSHIMILSGLFLIAFSREKEDNSLIGRQRYRAMKWALLAMAVIFLGLQINWEDLKLPSYDITVLIPYVGIGFYLLSFYLLLITHRKISSSTKKHSKFYLIYITSTMMITLLLAI